MIAFPNCKINLGLQILQKRSDGFHDLETVFYPVPLKDTLEIVPVQSASPKPVVYNYGMPVNGESSDNLCVKAWHLLKKDFPDLPAVDIHLLKNIPMGAGLGGGSADGAFMLKMLNNKFHLDITADRLIQYALQLGSDCPFFILNQPCYATGRGEVLTPVELDLSPYQLVLANPGIHINTGWAFSQLNINSSLRKDHSVKEALAQPFNSWKDLLLNEFEKPVFEKYPEIKSVKEKLYKSGAVYASMSGSGSTVFGLFDKNEKLAEKQPDHYTIIDL